MALGWSATDLGGLLYESLRTKLLVLPDASLVYPAHGAGSLCGKALGQETFSTIGEQRRANYALQPMSKAAFIELVTADQPDAPPYFTYDAVLNTKERPTLDETLAREVNPMTLDQLLALQSVGAQILDMRDPAEFAVGASRRQHQHRPRRTVRDVGGHRAEPGQADRDRRRPGTRARSRDAAGTHRLRPRRRLSRRAAWRAWQSRPELTTHVERLSAQVAAERTAAGDGDARPLVLDVRTPRGARARNDSREAWASRSIISPQRLSELPRERPLLVYCAGGYRSSIAASLLQHHGFTRVSEIAGGITAWEAAKLPVATGADA